MGNEINKKLAQQLLDDHTGIPDLSTSLELIEHFLRIIRKNILNKENLELEDIGTFLVKKSKKGYRLKFKSSVDISKMLNMI